MILNEAQPERSLYVIGAFLIDFLGSYADAFHITELHEATKEGLKISFAQFLLAIDWLFLTGLVAPTTDGRLKKCF